MKMTRATEKTFKDGCEDTPITDMNTDTIKQFIVEMGKRKDINSQSLNTYPRDLETLMYFFMRQEYIPTVKLNVPKVDKTSIETYSDIYFIRI